MYNQISTLKIEGIKRINWTDKNTKENKSGAILHCSYKEEGISGTGVATMFVSTDQLINYNLANGNKIQALDRGKFGWTFIQKYDEK